MSRLLHTRLGLLAVAVALSAWLATPATAQYQQRPGGHTEVYQPDESQPVEVKPDKVAAKAYAAGLKSLAKAHDLEETIGKTTDADKKAALTDKLGDAYGRALDQFTEVLRNRGTMYEAWSQVGYVHFRLGAYREAVDDYNHSLNIKADQPDALMYRAEAYMNLDRLDEAKIAYADLQAHSAAQAETLYTVMQRWVTVRRAAPNGMRTAEIDAFDKWLQAEPSAAKTAATPPAP